MGTVTSDSQKSLTPQQLKEGSPNQTEESYLKVCRNSKVNVAKNKQTCQSNDRKRLNIYHQNVRGLRGKTDELTGHLHPIFPHMLCLTEHHVNGEELQQTFTEVYNLDACFCRKSYAKGGVCTYVHKSLNLKDIDLEMYCIEKDFEVCALKLNLNFTQTCIITIYRAPGNFNLLLNELDLIVRKFSRKSGNTMRQCISSL
jgi:hypothetical protein